MTLVEIIWLYRRKYKVWVDVRFVTKKWKVVKITSLYAFDNSNLNLNYVLKERKQAEGVGE